MLPVLPLLKPGIDTALFFLPWFGCSPLHPFGVSVVLSLACAADRFIRPAMCMIHHNGDLYIADAGAFVIQCLNLCSAGGSSGGGPLTVTLVDGYLVVETERLTPA